MSFTTIQRPINQKLPPRCPPWGHLTRQTLKKLNLCGKNGSRQQCLDKRLQKYKQFNIFYNFLQIVLFCQQPYYCRFVFVFLRKKIVIKKTHLNFQVNVYGRVPIQLGCKLESCLRIFGTEAYFKKMILAYSGSPKLTIKTFSNAFGLTPLQMFLMTI